VREAIKKKVAPLSSDARDTIEVASMIGREFDVHLLSEVSGLTPSDCIARLAEAVSHGIVKDLGDAAGRFNGATRRWHQRSRMGSQSPRDVFG
jgi:hypothetical protein